METFLSLLVARSGEVLAPHVSWQAWSRARSPSSVEALLALVAPHNVPDFLTPLRTGGGLEGGIDAVLSSPRGQLRDGLSALATHRRLPAWTRKESCTRYSAGQRPGSRAAPRRSGWLLHHHWACATHRYFPFHRQSPHRDPSQRRLAHYPPHRN